MSPADLHQIESLSLAGDGFPVVAPTGGHWWIAKRVDEEAARRLIKDRKVTLIRTRTGIRVLRWIHEPGERISLAENGSDWHTNRYSHDHETDDNPENCWTLVHLRRSTRMIFHQVVASCHQDCPLSRVEEAERTAIVKACIKALSGRHGLLIRLRYEYGMTWEQVAERMNVTAAAVSAMHQRVLPILKAELKKHGVLKFADLV